LQSVLFLHSDFVACSFSCGFSVSAASVSACSLHVLLFCCLLASVLAGSCCLLASVLVGSLEPISCNVCCGISAAVEWAVSACFPPALRFPHALLCCCLLASVLAGSCCLLASVLVGSLEPVVLGSVLLLLFAVSDYVACILCFWISAAVAWSCFLHALLLLVGSSCFCFVSFSSLFVF
jgi:hypothetical protein